MMRWRGKRAGAGTKPGKFQWAEGDLCLHSVHNFHFAGSFPPQKQSARVLLIHTELLLCSRTMLENCCDLERRFPKSSRVNLNLTD